MIRIYNWIQEIRRCGKVMRMHTEPWGTQSIADHSWNVAMIAFALDREISRGGILTCLVHDIPEYHTGDTPANVKWRHPSLKAQLDSCEDFVHKIMGTDFDCSYLEKATIKLADTAELMFHCYDHRKMGNINADLVFNRLLARFEEPHRLIDQLCVDYVKIGGIVESRQAYASTDY